MGSSLSLRQPWVIPLGTNTYAVAAVATTAPCTTGQIDFEYETGTAAPIDASPPIDPQGTTCDPMGASLPSLAAIGTSSAIVAWYKARSQTEVIRLKTAGRPSRRSSWSRR